LNQAADSVFREHRATAAGVTISVVAIATFLLLPPFIEAAVNDLHYTEKQLGILSAVLAAGTTLASVTATLWIRRSSWRFAATAGLLGLILANGASIFVRDFLPFTALQGFIGFCGGSLYSLALTVLSDGRRPDRFFAYAVGAQTIYQILGLLAGPFFVHHGGVDAMLVLFAGLGVLGLSLARFLPVHGRSGEAGAAASSTAASGTGGGLLSWPVVLALAGCFLFYFNVGALWTYVERIGTTAGLPLGAVSNALAFSTAASMAGVFYAMWLGARRGFLMPIAASAIAIVVSVALLTGNLQMPAYVLSAVIYGIAWNVSITYQYSTVNLVDASRRGVALAPAFHNAGGAAGPAVAAIFVTEHDHGGVLWLVTGSVLLSWLCFQVSYQLYKRRSGSPA
jgi:predicted MFS family arabinose efflux permease